MTASEFLQQLEQNLQGLQAEERESAMAYYHEYFEEAGEEHEAEAVQNLGSPQSVAERIIRENGDESTFSPEENITVEDKKSADYSRNYDGTAAASTDNTGRIILAIVVILLTSPFWIAIPIVWFTIVFLLLFLPVVFACAGIGGVLQGFLEMIMGGVASGIFDIGGGMFCAGLAMLLWKPFFMGAWQLTKLFGKMCAGIYRFLTGKEKEV